MATTVYSDGGAVGSCPRIVEDEPPVVLLLVCHGEKSLTVSLPADQARRLGLSLVEDAQQINRHPFARASDD